MRDGCRFSSAMPDSLVQIAVKINMTLASYTVGGATFDPLVYGYYDAKDLLYAARTRNGFTPKLREELIKRFRGLETKDYPFVNLPEAKSGRWGRAYGSEDGGLPVAQAGAGRTV